MLKLKGVVEPKAKATKAEPRTHFVQKTIGSDTWLVMAQAQIELEDEFATLYYTTQNQSNIFLEPPFEPRHLLLLTQANNTLLQCIHAMEVNVDGTGHEFVPAEEGGQMDPEEVAVAKGFFDEPYPNTSFINIRRQLRLELESVGYAYLEILRNFAGEVVGCRNVETHNVRMVKLDEPVMTTRKVMRNGKEVELQMWERERRYAQRVALKTLVYYKDFGVGRHVDRNNGKWEVEGDPIAPENRGTELMLFGIHPSIETPYYVPRWINQLPSVVGSRKAEEQNLQFLDSGGMPPAIIFVQGGTLAKDASDQLRMYLSGENKNKYRAVVVEAQSSSGSLDSAGNVQVKVERFGAERAQDAMFMKYDANTEEHVRVGFRLPPLFLGKPSDYNFATAQTAYVVAEAQVFAPERQAFDEMMNRTIVKELGLKTVRFKSKPINLKDNESLSEGITQAKDLATRDSLLDEINKLTGMSLTLAPAPQPDTVTGTFGGGAGADPNAPMTQGGRALPTPPQTPPALPPPGRGESQKPQFQQGIPESALPGGATSQIKPTKLTQQPAAKPKTAMELIDLAQNYAAVRGLVKKADMTEDRGIEIRQAVDNLAGEELMAFNSLLATYTFGSDSPDLMSIVSRTR